MMLLLAANKETVIEKISSKAKIEMLENRIALKAIFSSIKYLARQGLAIRGHEESTSNLYQLLTLRSADIPELKKWMKRDGLKWLSGTISNEILGFFASKIRKMLSEEIKKAGIYAIMMDETADISTQEQVSICVRIVDEELAVSENFMGFYQTLNTKSDTLFKLLTDFLQNESLEIQDMRGQCYDGASNMSGRLNGLQTKVRAIEPRALFIHCFGHSLSLSVQESLQAILAVKNVIGNVKEMINFIKNSPKRLGQFQTIKDGADCDGPGFVPFNPTR